MPKSAASSSLSTSDYSLIEVPNDRLVSMKSKSILWPERVPKRRLQSPDTNEEVYQVPSSLFSSPSTSVNEVKRQRSWDASPGSSIEAAAASPAAAMEADSFALLGHCSREEAIKRLGSRWSAILFIDDVDGRSYLVLLHQDRKYMLAVEEVQLEEGRVTGWGIVWPGRRPDVIFRSRSKLAHFYSLSPEAAFFDI